MTEHALAHEPSSAPLVELALEAAGAGLPTLRGAAAGGRGSGAPAHDRRTADPVAIALLDYVARGTRAEQEFVFRAAARVLGLALSEDEAEAAEAVQACMQALDLDEVPSREVYREWVSREPVWREWPSDHFVAKAFGGRWTAVRSRLAAKPVADLRALGLATLGNQLEDEELLEGIRRWRVEQPDPRFRFGSFRRWAEARLQEQAHGTAAAVGPAGEVSVCDQQITGDVTGAAKFRVAVAPNTYIKRFGSWISALAAAGVLDDISFADLSRLAQSDRHVDEEVIFGLLRDADAWARRTTGRPLTRASLDTYRERILQVSWESKRFEPLPHATTIIRRFDGSLVKAFLAAGVIDREEALRRVARTGVKLREEELAAHVQVCAAHHGIRDVASLPVAVYDRWRDAAVEALLEPVPHSATICVRLGCTGWGAAARAAAAMTTDTEMVVALEEKYAAALAQEAINHA